MIVGTLDAALASVRTDYHRLVLLVGQPQSGKTRQLRECAHAGGFPIVSVGGPAAARLLEYSDRQRRHQVADVIADLVERAEGNVVLLDDLELLFQPSLAVDPLRLLRSLARNRTIVATWSGSYRDRALTYADAAHPEYRVYHDPDVTVVPVGAPATSPCA